MKKKIISATEFSREIGNIISFAENPNFVCELKMLIPIRNKTQLEGILFENDFKIFFDRNEKRIKYIREKNSIIILLEFV